MSSYKMVIGWLALFALIWSFISLAHQSNSSLVETAIASADHCRWPKIDQCKTGKWFVGGPDQPALLEYARGEGAVSTFVPASACEDGHFYSGEYLNENYNVCRLARKPLDMDQEAELFRELKSLANEGRH
jgi:hypothetical protein